MAVRCPACGSESVIEKKFGFGDRSWIEKWCCKCDLLEEKSNRDEDYLAWEARWSGTGPGATKPRP